MIFLNFEGVSFAEEEHISVECLRIEIYCITKRYLIKWNAIKSYL